jgi:hypothetical protein|tara:strand:- start:1447 stop:1578 length:132 start_codon:yes stop_codon:yes gene_type:complete
VDTILFSFVLSVSETGSQMMYYREMGYTDKILKDALAEVRKKK